MTTSLATPPKLQFFDLNGAPLSGGKLYTYVAGTTTPQVTYTDYVGGTANTNPVILDSRGEASVWLNTPLYKMALYSATDVLIWTVDNIGGFATLAQLAASGGSSLVGYLPAGTGAVATTVQTKLRESVSVLDFGADPTGVADSTTTIQAAIDAALAAGKQIIAQGTFRISSKIVIKGDTDFSQATFNVYSTPAVAVEVSSGNATDPTTAVLRSVIWLPKRIVNMTKPATGWAGQGVGVRTVNLSACQVFIGGISDFATGLQITSFGSNGNVYNNYYLSWLQNNQVNLALTPGNTTSWCNENVFIGGQLSHNSGEGADVAGTRHLLISKATNVVNNNLFVKPSLEGDVVEYNVENSGSLNTIQQGRWESTTPKVLYSYDNANQSIENVILGGYKADLIAFTFTGTGGGANNQVLGVKSNNYQTGSSATGIWKMMNSGSSAEPIFTFYEASVPYRPELATATDYAMRFSAQTLKGKTRTDAYDRIKLDWSAGSLAMGDGTVASTRGLNLAGSSALVLTAPAAGVVRTSVDNSTSLGTATFRWSVVYAGTGTINTSDARSKQDIENLDDTEKRVAIALKGLIKKFRFKDAVDAKSDSARIHIGVIAQEVISVFEAENLNPMRYSIVCYDEWDAEPEELDADGSVAKPAREAGNRYGVRYEELLAFIISAL